MENSVHVCGEPVVSICCDTYNHAPYIRDALDGFLMQETSFPFEIIVHDDASTDGTADILRAYEQAHPDVFRCVYRTENMYVSDPKILEHHVFPLARGRYVAICEGDDYWTDPNKLQKQIDYMEAHPQCTLCVCGAELRDADNQIIGSVAPYAVDTDVSMDELIRGGGGFVATASIVAPTRLCKQRAPYCDMTEVDDAALLIWFGQNGTTHYIAQEMCAYRVALPGSWTESYFAADAARRTRIHEELIGMLRAFDAETGGRWHESVEQVIAEQHQYQIHFINNDISALKKEPFRAQYRALPLRRRIRMHLVRLGLLPNRHRY